MKQISLKTYNKKIQKILDSTLPIEDKLTEALSYASTITIVNNDDIKTKNTKKRTY